MVHPIYSGFICHLRGCEGARTPQELIIPGFKKIKLIDSSGSLLWGNPRLLVYGLHMSPTWISIPTPSLRGSIRKLLTNLINTYETQNSISRRIADLLYSRKAVELCCICGYSWEHSYFKCPSCGNNLRDRFKVLIAYNITFRKSLACGHIIGIIEESP